MITLKNKTLVGPSSIGHNDAQLEDIILLFTIDSRVMNLIRVSDHQ
jgi:hypothetical protein